jgi:hypothetical protein
VGDALSLQSGNRICEGASSPGAKSRFPERHAASPALARAELSRRPTAGPCEFRAIEVVTVTVESAWAAPISVASGGLLSVALDGSFDGNVCVSGMKHALDSI